MNFNKQKIAKTKNATRHIEGNKGVHVWIWVDEEIEDNTEEFIRWEYNDVIPVDIGL